MATFLFSVYNRQPATPPVPWLTMDTANRCQKRKPTVFLYSWLHSKAVERRQSHGSWDPYEKTYNILLTYPRMTESKQSRTAQLEEIEIWLQIQTFSQKYWNSSLCLLEYALSARGFPTSLPVQFMVSFTLLLIAQVCERKVNSLAFNGVALLLVQWGFAYAIRLLIPLPFVYCAGMSLHSVLHRPYNTAAEQLICPTTPTAACTNYRTKTGVLMMDLSTESLSVSGYSQYWKSTSNCWVCEMEVRHLSKTSHGNCSPTPPTPAIAVAEISKHSWSKTGDIFAWTETYFLHWDVIKRGNYTRAKQELLHCIKYCAVPKAAYDQY